MAALKDPVPTRSASIIEFAAFRRAAPAAGETAGHTVEAAPVVVAFPGAARPAKRAAPAAADVAAAADLRHACEALVERFRTMHEAMIELIVTCRELDESRAWAFETSRILMDIAALSSTSERFQTQLAATFDSAGP
jgi:hypothetical protein